MYYLLSIFLAVIGGLLADKIGIPLPWMLGPLFTIGFFCAIKIEIKLPKKPLPLARALLGCVIGTNFTNEIFININQIGKSLVLLPFFVIFMVFCTYLILKKIMKYDKKTSLIGSMPGGLNEMVLLTSEIGGKERTVTLLNTTRIIIVVTIVSILTHLFADNSINETSENFYFSHLNDLFYIFLISIIGFFIGKTGSLPGYSIIGPMLLSSFLHAFDIINITPNIILIIVLQIYLGSNLGLYFKGIKLNEFLRPIKAGILSTLISFVILGLFIFILSFHGHDLLSLILSYAPVDKRRCVFLHYQLVVI